MCRTLPSSWPNVTMHCAKVTVSGYTRPSSLFLMTVEDLCAGGAVKNGQVCLMVALPGKLPSMQPLKTLPAFFKSDDIEVQTLGLVFIRPTDHWTLQPSNWPQGDPTVRSNCFVLRQFFATSLDGTKVPYFQLSKKGMACDGSNPTLILGQYQLWKMPFRMRPPTQAWWTCQKRVESPKMATSKYDWWTCKKGSNLQRWRPANMIDEPAKKGRISKDGDQQIWLMNLQKRVESPKMATSKYDWWTCKKGSNLQRWRPANMIDEPAKKGRISKDGDQQIWLMNLQKRVESPKMATSKYDWWTCKKGSNLQRWRPANMIDEPAKKGRISKDGDQQIWLMNLQKRVESPKMATSKYDWWTCKKGSNLQRWRPANMVDEPAKKGRISKDGDQQIWLMNLQKRVESPKMATSKYDWWTCKKGSNLQRWRPANMIDEPAKKGRISKDGDQQIWLMNLQKRVESPKMATSKYDWWTCKKGSNLQRWRPANMIDEPAKKGRISKDGDQQIWLMNLQKRVESPKMATSKYDWWTCKKGSNLQRWRPANMIDEPAKKGRIAKDGDQQIWLMNLQKRVESPKMATSKYDWWTCKKRSDRQRWRPANMVDEPAKNGRIAKDGDQQIWLMNLQKRVESPKMATSKYDWWTCKKGSNLQRWRPANMIDEPAKKGRIAKDGDQQIWLMNLQKRVESPKMATSKYDWWTCKKRSDRQRWRPANMVDEPAKNGRIAKDGDQQIWLLLVHIVNTGCATKALRLWGLWNLPDAFAIWPRAMESQIWDTHMFWILDVVCRSSISVCDISFTSTVYKLLSSSLLYKLHEFSEQQRQKSFWKHHRVSALQTNHHHFTIFHLVKKTPVEPQQNGREVFRCPGDRLAGAWRCLDRCQPPRRRGIWAPVASSGHSTQSFKQLFCSGQILR